MCVLQLQTVSLHSVFVSDKESGDNVRRRQSAGMPGFSPSRAAAEHEHGRGTMHGHGAHQPRAASRSPLSGTDADSALGAEVDSSTSPELRHETDFADEGEETFGGYGENDEGGDYDPR